MVRFINPDFNSRKANYLANKGEIIQISRGIYADIGDSIEDIHAQGLRIIAYRYPNARLMGESARRASIGLTPILPNGNVYIEVAGAGQRRVRELVKNVSVILREQKNTPYLHQSKKVSIQVEPGINQWIFIPSIAQMILDAVNYPEMAMSDAEFISLFDQLPGSVAMSLELNQGILSKQEQAWANSHVKDDVSSEAKTEFKLYLADKIAANLKFDGISWVMTQESELPSLFKGTESQKNHLMTGWVSSLLPQGWTLDIDGGRNSIEEYAKKLHTLMNATLVPKESSATVVINRGFDFGRLKYNTDSDAVFIGVSDSDFSKLGKIKKAYESDQEANRLSGTQAKIGACIYPGGILEATDSTSPMTHIVKPDPLDKNRGTHGVAALEWAGQIVARYSGLETPDVALMPAPDGGSASLISERFDIPFDEDDSIYKFGVDGSAAMGIDEESIFSPSATQVFKAFLDQGLPRSECTKFFDRFAYAWLSGDSDLHAKNISIKKTLNKNGDGWDVKMAPAYDTVSTFAFKGAFSLHDECGLIVGHKRNDLTLADWAEFGRVLGVPDAGDRMVDMANRVTEGYCALANAGDFWDKHFNSEYAGRAKELMANAAQVAQDRAKTLGIEPQNIQMTNMKSIMDVYNNGRKIEFDDVNTFELDGEKVEILGFE